MLDAAGCTSFYCHQIDTIMYRQRGVDSTEVMNRQSNACE